MLSVGMASDRAADGSCSAVFAGLHEGFVNEPFGLRTAVVFDIALVHGWPRLGIGARFWGRHSGYETADDCESALQFLKAQAAQARQIARGVMQQQMPYIVLRDELTLQYESRCAPAAVDLRTPRVDRPSPSPN